jgi:hypothetical protein
MTIKLPLIVGDESAAFSESNNVYLRFDNALIDFTLRAKLIDVPGTV